MEAGVGGLPWMLLSGHLVPICPAAWPGGGLYCPRFTGCRVQVSLLLGGRCSAVSVERWQQRKREVGANLRAHTGQPQSRHCQCCHPLTTWRLPPRNRLTGRHAFRKAGAAEAARGQAAGAMGGSRLLFPGQPPFPVSVVLAATGPAPCLHCACLPGAGRSRDMHPKNPGWQRPPLDRAQGRLNQIHKFTQGSPPTCRCRLLNTPRPVSQQHSDMRRCLQPLLPQGMSQGRWGGKYTSSSRAAPLLTSLLQVPGTLVSR